MNIDNLKTRLLKPALIMAGLGLISSNAFAAGTVTGTIEASIAKYKKDVVVPGF
jgi:hypothetical protein